MNLNFNRMRVTLLAAALLLILGTGIIGCSGNSVTPREGSLQGRIIDKSGLPVEDALVTWEYDNTRWALTDADGKYYLEAIGFGDQTFLVQAFAYHPSRFGIAIYSGQTSTAEDFAIEAKSFDYLEIEVEEVSATHAVISWKTTDYTNGLVEYGETESYGRTVREDSGVYATTHSVRLIDLSPEKQYFFRIVANREGRSTETSTSSSFVTQNSLEDKTPPSAPTGVSAALTSTPGQVTVFWAAVADPDLKGYKVYRSELANATFSQVSNTLIPKGQERFTDYTAVAGKKYHYRVTAIDQAGNEGGYNNVASMLVPGNISTEVRWIRANSPYVLAGDLNITETGILNIDSGVEVLIAESDAFRLGDANRVEITVSGAIVASATADFPVIFASQQSNPEKGEWGGIKFENVESTVNTLVNAVISDAATGLHISNSAGIFSTIAVKNCNTAVKVENCLDLQIDRVTAQRCSTGMELKSNTNLFVSNSTIIHPAIGISSQLNDSIEINGCNFLEYTDTGLISNEAGGTIRFTNNLFVSPLGTGIKLTQRNATIDYNTFDSPYLIQISQGSPIIQKNLFMARRSAFGTGQKGIEHLLGTLPLPTFGPNNMTDFNSDVAYVGCTASDDSTSESILMMMELTGDKYDYRLRQPYPDTEDTWGINRETIPYEE
ncbi:MAG: hypothetical protein GQF41_3652 [Candidatus Rifleibacterium amylolyticum]|nr:MAG: hypothetical protein GQF41_3652 [Candidatus Rifleibacterium amylolyticum]